MANLLTKSATFTMSNAALKSKLKSQKSQYLDEFLYNVLQIFVAEQFGHSISKARPVKQLRSAIKISSAVIIGNLYLNLKNPGD